MQLFQVLHTTIKSKVFYNIDVPPPTHFVIDNRETADRDSFLAEIANLKAEINSMKLELNSIPEANRPHLYNKILSEIGVIENVLNKPTATNYQNELADIRRMIDTLSTQVNQLLSQTDPNNPDNKEFLEEVRRVNTRLQILRRQGSLSDQTIKFTAPNPPSSLISESGTTYQEATRTGAFNS